MSSEPSFFKYADDNQIFFSDCDLVVVKSAINGDLAVDDNKLVLNPKKCKCIILPKYHPCDLSLSINDVQVPIVDYLDLLGVTVTINNLLNFSKHIAMITQKIGKQLDVLSRLKNMLSIFLKMCPYNLYINVRAPRCGYNKRVPLYGNDDYGLTLSNCWLQDIAIMIFTVVNGMLLE